jgi:hypothetical protein
MAALRFALTTAEIAANVAAAKTLLQLVAAANHRVKVESWGVFFDGQSTTAEPVQVRLLRQTTAGTMTALTPAKLDNGIGDTVQSTAQVNATAEPTAGDVVDVVEVHPQQGYEVIFPPGQEVIVDGGGRLAVEITAPAAVNARAKMRCEE